MIRWCYLIPKIEWGSWSGDGMHSRYPGGVTYVDGRNLSISWLGLHVEFVIAVERGL